MERDRARADAAPGLVVAFYIVHDLVGVDVGVVVGDDDRVWMRVECSWAERADDEVEPLEGQVDRGRHVELAGDGGEVSDVEAVGVVAAVPAHDFERVVWVDIGVDGVACLDADFELALFVVCEWVVFVLEGDAEVAFAVGGVLEELCCFLGDVTRWRGDVAGVAGLEAEELAQGHVCFGMAAEVIVVRAVVWAIVEYDFVDDTLGEDDVVLGAKLERAKHGVDGA